MRSPTQWLTPYQKTNSALTIWIFQLNLCLVFLFYIFLLPKLCECSFTFTGSFNVHPISDKTGFRGPFMIEKIHLAIGNYRFLSFKCVFGELQCIRPKVLAILGFGF